MIGGLFLNI
uniref:Truncated accessory 3c protein n=1 Tax=Feline coronavirus TaxID=12663 RepID=A0A8E7IND4_9ALPC|nr:truncated accessory 3c protein [Feline coronavirus]